MLLGCATQHSEQPSYSFEQANELALKQWKANKDNETYISFSNAFFIEVTRHSSSTIKKCQLMSNERQEIVLVQLNSGKIGQVIAKNETEKSRCVREIFIGKNFPKPPFSPIFKGLKL